MIGSTFNRSRNFIKIMPKELILFWMISTNNSMEIFPIKIKEVSFHSNENFVD